MTLDTGALIAIERGDRRVWTFIKSYVDAGYEPTVPAPVLAETWRSKQQVVVARLLRHCRVEVLTDPRARAAGELCGKARSSDPVDAIVIESASRRKDIVLTSDPDDMRRLASFVTGVVVRPVSD